MVPIGRFVCAGLLVLAAIGLLGGSAWAEQKAQPEQQAATTEKADPAPSPAPTQSLAPKKPEPYEPTCSSPKDQGEKDLCESIRANDLAAKNLYWVRIGTGAVLLSLIFTGWAAWAAAVAAGAARKSVEHAEADAGEQSRRFEEQLKVAKTAADAATAAAKSTAESVEATHSVAAGTIISGEAARVTANAMEIMVSSGRQSADAAALLATTAAENLALFKAQVAPHVIVVEGRLCADNLTAPFRADLVFENVGQIAARNTSVILNITFQPYPLVGKLIAKRLEGGISKHTVAPHVQFSQDAALDRALTSDEMTALQSGEMAIFVWGSITHDGLNGEPIVNSFRYFLGGEFGVRPGFPLCPHPEGNT